VSKKHPQAANHSPPVAQGPPLLTSICLWSPAIRTLFLIYLTLRGHCQADNPPKGLRSLFSSRKTNRSLKLYRSPLPYFGEAPLKQDFFHEALFYQKTINSPLHLGSFLENVSSGKGVKTFRKTAQSAAAGGELLKERAVDLFEHEVDSSGHRLEASSSFSAFPRSVLRHSGKIPTYERKWGWCRTEWRTPGRSALSVFTNGELYTIHRSCHFLFSQYRSILYDSRFTLYTASTTVKAAFRDISTTRITLMGDSPGHSRKSEACNPERKGRSQNLSRFQTPHNKILIHQCVTHG